MACYFAVFNRIALAAGFIPSGFVKIFGERFTSLSNNHPMGHYLEALFHTGFYYTTIGVFQVGAAILLLIPRTATLGAIIYFPIILNICILSLSVRFDGSLMSSPLMVLANLYLLLWDYHKLKWIFPFNHKASDILLPQPREQDNKFPFKFFAGVIGAIFLLVFSILITFKFRPYNTLKDCQRHCVGDNKSNACLEFCDCVHQQGQPLHKCMDDYKNAPNDTNLPH